MLLYQERKIATIDEDLFLFVFSTIEQAYPTNKLEEKGRHYGRVPDMARTAGETHRKP
jgi:hypothetical protein